MAAKTTTHPDEAAFLAVIEAYTRLSGTDPSTEQMFEWFELAGDELRSIHGVLVRAITKLAETANGPHDDTQHLQEGNNLYSRWQELISGRSG